MQERENVCVRESAWCECVCMCVYVFCFLPARASEQGNVIGSVRIYIYIYICVYKKKL